MSTDEESSLLQESGDDDRDLENGSPRFRIGTGFLAVMLVSNFLASSDDSFVLSSASEIAADLKTTKASTWLITGFNLGYMVSLPVNGYLCAALGRKQTYLFSNAVYGAGCLAMGTSLNIYVSILARIVTGFGSSGILDLSSVLINDLGGPFEAAVLRSYFMTVMMIGYSGGGTLGGLLATLVGWRWSFLLHVPIILICALVTLIQLPRDIPRVLQAPLGDNGEEQETKASKPMSMDIVGIILLVGAIVSTLMMIQVLQEDIVPDNKLYIGTALGTISLLLVGIFFINEVWWAKKPLFPLSFMLSSQTGIVCAVQVLAMISDLALSSTISDYFVRTKDFSMVAASACLAPSALGGALGGYLAGNHIQRTGRYQKLTQMGLSLCIVSCTLIMVRWCFFNPSLVELFYPFCYGVGLGIVFSTQFVVLAAHSPRKYVTRLITTYYMMQQIGSVIGASVTACLIRSSFASDLTKQFGQTSQGVKMVKNILEYPQYTASLPDEVRKPVEAIFRKSFLAAPAIILVSLIITFCLVKGETERQEETRLHESDHD